MLATCYNIRVLQRVLIPGLYTLENQEPSWQAMKFKYLYHIYEPRYSLSLRFGRFSNARLESAGINSFCENQLRTNKQTKQVTSVLSLQQFLCSNSHHSRGDCCPVIIEGLRSGGRHFQPGCILVVSFVNGKRLFPFRHLMLLSSKVLTTLFLTDAIVTDSSHRMGVKVAWAGSDCRMSDALDERSVRSTDWKQDRRPL